MQLFEIVHLFVAVSQASQMIHGLWHCASFNTTRSVLSGNTKYRVTVAVTIKHDCGNDDNNLKSVKVFKNGTANPAPTMCHISFKDNICSGSGCSCDSKGFSMTRDVPATPSEAWRFIGQLKNGSRFEKLVEVNANDDFVDKAETTTSDFGTTQADQINTGETSVSSIQDSKPEETTQVKIIQDIASGHDVIKSLRESQDFLLHVLLSSIGFVLLVVVVLFVVIGVILKKRGRPAGIVPPPVPHNIRRWAADAVAFRAQPRPQQEADTRDSAPDHFYAEIPDDADSTSSEPCQAVPAALQPDDYLNPTSTAEVTTSVPAKVTMSVEPPASNVTVLVAAGGIDSTATAVKKSDGEEIIKSMTDEATGSACVKLTRGQIETEEGAAASAILADPPYENTINFP